MPAPKDALAEERERQMDTIEDIAVLGALLVFSSLSLALIVLMYWRAIPVFRLASHAWGKFRLAATAAERLHEHDYLER
jgi:hypothetical protein